MFFETPSPEYWAPVSYRQLGPQGELVEKKFDMQFKRLSPEALQAIEGRVKALPEGNDAALLAEVTTAWRVQDETSKAQKVIAFDAKTLADMEQAFPGFTFVCAVGFYASRTPTSAAHFAAKN